MGIPRKSDQPLEPHWDIALGAAIGLLKSLVYEFDIINARIDARGHAFAGVREPQELIEIINRFLDEDDLFTEGEINLLKRMRQYLEETIMPTFESGRKTAQQYWENASPEQQADLANWQFEDFRAEANSQAPESSKNDPCQKAWFVEAFSKSWQDQWMRSIAKSIGKEWPIPPDNSPKV